MTWLSFCCGTQKVIECLYQCYDGQEMVRLKMTEAIMKCLDCSRWVVWTNSDTFMVLFLPCPWSLMIQLQNLLTNFMEKSIQCIIKNPSFCVLRKRESHTGWYIIHSCLSKLHLGIVKQALWKMDWSGITDLNCSHL